MYKLSRRKNIWPFLILLGVGLAISIGVPPLFPEQRFEIPAFALFPAEIALVMMLSVLFFENATPAELLRLSFTMLTLVMVSGMFSNYIARSSQTLPDSTLLLNWVELICMNIAGLVATVALYQTRSDTPTQLTAVRDVNKEKAAVARASLQDLEALGDRPDLNQGESAKDILDSLDVSRINRLEKQITRRGEQQPDNLSLDALFEDESHAAGQGQGPIVKAARGQGLDSLLADSSVSIPKPDPQELAPPLPAPPLPILTPEPTQAKAQIPKAPAPQPVVHDISASIDDLFGDMGIGQDMPLTEALPPSPSPVANLSPSKEQETTLTDSENVKAATPVAPAGLVESAPPAEAAPASNVSHLFDESHLGGDLEDIFSNIAGDAAHDEFSKSKLAEVKAHHHPEPAAPASATPIPVPAAKAEGGLFGDGLGDDLDNIFNNIAPEAANKEVSDLLGKDSLSVSAASIAPLPAPAPVTPPQAPTPAGQKSAGGKEVKEFGRLSAAATAKPELSAPGTLKTIGQMLLDTQAVENIIKRTENRSDEPLKTTAATARVVTVSRGADIQAMLNNVAAFPGIDGCLVIGKDGLLIGATESLGMMKDVLGVLALGIHSTTGLGTKKVDLGELRQAILRTGEKVSILTEVGIGVLACFSNQWKLDSIDAMVDHIWSVVKDSQASGGGLPTESLTGSMLAAAAEPASPKPAPAAAPAPQAPKPAEAQAPQAEAKGGGLLSVSDDDIGGLFDGILSESSGHDDLLKSNPASAKAASTPAAAQANAGGLINVDDQLIGDIFDNLLDKQAPVEKSMDFTPPLGTKTAEPAVAAPKAEAPKAEAPKAEAAKAEPEAPAPAPAKPAGPAGKQMKEFGRLSVNTSAASDVADGAIKAIGRQLIDVQAVENIIKAGEKREKMGSGLTTARVISAARGEGIKALLTKIDACPGVCGSLIVGNDGLVIASTLQTGLDKDLLGALCTAMHSHTELASKKVEMGKLKQIIFHATDKMTILTAVAVGVLAVFVENHDMTKVDSLLAAIEQTVRG